MRNITHTPKRSSRLFAIFTVFVIFLSFGIGCFSNINAHFHNASAKNKIRVGWFIVEGYQYYDINGNRTGYGYDYLQELSHYASFEYEFVDGTWEECYQMLLDGEIDLLPFVQHTPERSEDIDFTSASMGEIYTTITALTSNTSLNYDNPNSLDGKKVATINGSIQISQFEEWCDYKDIECNTVNFIDPTSALPSLYNGSVDALLTTSFRRLTNGEKVIAKFSPNQVRMAVSKDNKQLKNTLDEAMSKILFDHPTLLTILSNKYFSDNIQKSYPLSQSEKEYLESLPRLKVVSTVERPPLTYSLNGAETGFYFDMLDLVCNRLNLSYDYITVNNYDESLELIKNGNADIVLDFAFDYAWADKYNVSPTATYITMQYCKIEQKSLGKKDNLTVAAPKGLRFSKEYTEKNYPAQNIKWFDDTTACMEAVRKGECDITFAPIFTSDYFLADYKYNNLMSTHISFTQDSTIAISNKHDSLLPTLFSRIISSISPTEINELMSKHTLQQAKDIGIWKVVYENPMFGIVIVGIISFTIVVLLVIVIYTRGKYNKKLIENINTDRITKGMSFEKFIIDAGHLISSRGTQKYGVLYIDIQNFKYINDTFGRKTGDKWLKGVHDYLTSTLWEGELAARAYADHFILCFKFADKEQTNKRLEQLWRFMNTLSTQFGHYSALFRVGIYILQPDDYEITKAIDAAIYAINTLDTISENSVVYYNDFMRTKFDKERTLERDMSSALDHQDFVTYYQPKFNINTKKIIGAEALVRWSHPIKGLIPPNDFIPFFEKNNFIIKLDLYIFEQVSKHLREMMDLGIRPVITSINFSRRHLHVAGWIDSLIAISEKYNVPTNLYELELTETVAEENFALVSTVTRKLRELGFRIAIDDFGSGYSSIQLLYRIPIDVLKMDKSCFDIEEYAKIKREVLESVVETAIQNDIDVIWEGVETIEQEQLVNEFGCSSAQGFLYFKPMPYSEFKTLLIEQQETEDNIINIK